MLAQLIRFLDDESGTSLIEFALVAALVSISIFGTLETMGATLSEWFFTISGELVKASPDGG